MSKQVDLCNRFPLSSTDPMQFDDYDCDFTPTKKKKKNKRNKDKKNKKNKRNKDKKNKKDKKKDKKKENDFSY